MYTIFLQFPDQDRTWLQKELFDYFENPSQQMDLSCLMQFVDARHLSCPMPLLKAKIQLRSLADGEALYLLASDKNSQTDIQAFCYKNQLKLWQWHGFCKDNKQLVYHFVIKKPDINQDNNNPLNQ